MKKRHTMIPAIALSLFFAWNAQGHDLSVNTHGPVNDCSDVTFRFDGADVVRGEQKLQIGGNLLALRLGASKGIPLRISGSDRSGYELLLCKGARTAADLAAIRFEQKGAEVSVSGIDDEAWGGYLLVQAPRSAQLDVDTGNGPVSVSDVAGRLEMRTGNGPVSLNHVGGAVNVEAKNGPLSYSGSSGDVKISALNGPMTIQLEGSSWSAGEFEASTKNGPLSLRVPEGYGSGITVQKRPRTPFNCPSELCGKREPFFNDDDESVAIGSGPQVIRVGSDNGPISIGRPRS